MTSDALRSHHREKNNKIVLPQELANTIMKKNNTVEQLTIDLESKQLQAIRQEVHFIVVFTFEHYS